MYWELALLLDMLLGWPEVLLRLLFFMRIPLMALLG
jgi:hypothetical protein